MLWSGSSLDRFELFRTAPTGPERCGSIRTARVGPERGAPVWTTPAPDRPRPAPDQLRRIGQARSRTERVRSRALCRAPERRIRTEQPDTLRRRVGFALCVGFYYCPAVQTLLLALYMGGTADGGHLTILTALHGRPALHVSKPRGEPLTAHGAAPLTAQARARQCDVDEQATRQPLEREAAVARATSSAAAACTAGAEAVAAARRATMSMTAAAAADSRAQRLVGEVWQRWVREEV